MTPVSNARERVAYAAFRLRFRALIVDVAICVGLFVVGGLIAGIVWENSASGRIAAFAVLLGVIIGYEPFMVARYGGTFGHLKNNIRVVNIQNEENLSFWRAAARSLVKQLVGLVSFAFMIVTRKAQSLHDLAAGARVVLRNPAAAVAEDRFKPPSGIARRIVVILLCNLILVMLASLVSDSIASASCVDQGLCSEFEDSVLAVVALSWLALAGLSIVLGWMGKLPGCRPVNPDLS